jgi:hypothetical protein
MPTCTSRTVVRLAIEYLLITLPIVIYTSLEALHEGSVAPLLHSPEWSIATIFLAFQTVRLFVENMDRTSGRLMAIVLVIVLMLLITAASINTYMGLETKTHQSPLLVLTRWALLLAASLFFVYFAGAAIWTDEAAEKPGHTTP